MPSVSGDGQGHLAIPDGGARDARSARVWAEIEEIDPPAASVHLLAQAHDRPVQGDRVDIVAGRAGAWTRRLRAARALLEVLRSRRIVVRRVVVLSLVLVALLSLSREPLFEAKASVLVRPLAVGTEAGNIGADEPISLSTERAMMGSVAVVERVERRLGSLTASQLLTRVSVESDEAGPVLTVSFRDPYPARARDGAQAFAEAYLEQRRDAVEQARTERAAEIQAAIDRAAGELADETARAERVGELNRQLAAATTMSTDPGAVISSPTLPTTPVVPSHARNLGLGLVIGALLGMVAAVVADHRDDHIRTATEVERRLALPVLARVGSQRLGAYSQARVAMLDDPGGAAADSFRRLRAHLSPQLSSLLVTSATGGEGKALVATNLAVAYAQAGQRVLLVCADLHDPAIHWLLRVSNERGLSSVLADTARISDVVQRAATLPLLDVVPAGPTPDDPSDLRPDALQPLLWRLARRYDLVVFDAPPVLEVMDSLDLCGLVDAVVLTALTGQTRRRDLADAASELARARARILGTVILEVAEEASDRLRPGRP